MRRLSLVEEEPTGLRKLGLSPAREKMEEVKPKEMPSLAILEPPATTPDKDAYIERLKTLEYEGLPITTPEAKEAFGKALAIPRGAMEAALATGTGMVNFMTGWTGYRMMSELAAGRPLDEAIEKGGVGLWTYEPKTDWGRKMTEIVSKPFELLRRGTVWLAPHVLRGHLMMTPEQFEDFKDTQFYPYAAAAIGTIIEAGTLAAFGEILKARTKGRRPTPVDVTEAARESLKQRKAEVLRKAEAERPLSEQIVEAAAREVERPAVEEPVPTPVIEPPVAPGMYKGLRPGTWEWKEHWKAHPEEQKAMLKYRRGDETLAPEVAKTEDGLPIEPEAKPVTPEPEVVPKPEAKPYKMSFIDRKTAGRVVELDAEGMSPAEIASKLRAHEGDVVRVLESLEKPKKTVAMEAIEKEFEGIVKEAKDLDDLYTRTRELTTRYEDNLDVGFPDEFEALRYREWGDQIMGKINARRRKAGLPAEPEAEAELINFELAKKRRQSMTVDDLTLGQLEIVSNLVGRPLGMKFEWNALQQHLYDKFGLKGQRLVDTTVREVRDMLSKKEARELLPNNRVIDKVLPDKPSVDWFGETADFMGFQKMYESLVDRIKSRAATQGKKISPQGEAMLERGEVIKQRKTKYGYRPPIYESEFFILKNAKVLDEPWINRYWRLQNPSRIFREAGGEQMLDLTMHPYHAAENAYMRTWDAAKSRIGKLRKQVNWRERRRIMAYAISKQPKGDALLKWTGIKKVPVELTPKEMAVYNELRARYESLYVRLNRTRRAIGMKELPKTDDYFTFFRHMTIMERMGFLPWKMPADVLNNQFISMRATPFKFAKARGHALYKLEMDPFYVLEQYTKSALRHIHMSPFIAKINEYLTTIKDPVTGHPFKMWNENPALAIAMHDWINYIAGTKPISLGRIPDRIMLRINSNLTASILGANVRSAMIQVSALRNTVAKIGYIDTIEGILSLIDPKRRSFAWRKSKVIGGRVMDVTIEDAIKAIRAKRFGVARAATARAAMKPLQVTDLETAKATFNGAYRHARKRLGMDEKRAAVFADDVVTETQASAMPGDIAPIQRHVPGKLLTLFQTFTINDWNFLIRDVLGVKNASISTPKAFANVMRYVTATTLINILMEDVLKINSPFPTPIRAFRESLERGDDIPSLLWNVGKEFIEPIPIIGSARYGIAPGGPASELARETLKYIRDDPMQRPWWDIYGRWFGVPGTAQVSKMKRAIKRGETPYGQIVGTYTPPEERSAPLRRRGTIRRIDRARR